MKLTEEQLNSFSEDGFLLLRNFASIEECDKILEVVNKELKNIKEPIETEGEYNEDKNRTIRRLRQAYDRSEIFKKWMKNREIYPILKQVLNDNPVLVLANHNSVMTKMPKTSTASGWHQDKRYWYFENSNLVSVWLALGDENLDNGVLEFIPGSFKMEFKEYQFDKKLFFREDLEENQEIIKNRVHFNLSKGDVVLFHCETLHRANPNITDKPKISFVYTVRGENNKPIKNTRSDFLEIKLSGE